MQIKSKNLREIKVENKKGQKKQRMKNNEVNQRVGIYTKARIRPYTVSDFNQIFGIQAYEIADVGLEGLLWYTFSDNETIGLFTDALYDTMKKVIEGSTGWR